METGQIACVGFPSVHIPYVNEVGDGMERMVLCLVRGCGVLHRVLQWAWRFYICRIYSCLMGPPFWGGGIIGLTEGVCGPPFRRFQT